MSDKQHVMGAAAEASEPALALRAKPASGLDATRFDQAQGEEPDLSWIDIAVIRNGHILADFSPGWTDYFDNFDMHVEDCIETSVTMPTEVGMYRWSGYSLSYWDVDDLPNIKGGTFTRLAALEASSRQEERLRAALERLLTAYRCARAGEPLTLTNAQIETLPAVCQARAALEPPHAKDAADV